MDIRTIIQNEPKVVVKFFAEWCAPCKLMNIILNEIENSIDDVVFIDVDAEKELSLVNEYNVYSVPTFIKFVNGKEVGRKVGFIPQKLFVDWIRS